MLNALKKFVREEEGAQIIEYALIIAVVSLALIGLFSTLIDTSFDEWIDDVAACLGDTASGGTCPA